MSSTKNNLQEQEYFKRLDDCAKDESSTGKRNNKRLYKKETPAVLQNCSPKVNEISFMYRIVIRPLSVANRKSSKVFHGLYGNQNEFGILTSKKIPKLCKFSLFPSCGEIEVEISDMPFPVTLKNQSELKTLQDFHVSIFRDVLDVWQEVFELDKTSYLVVPLKNHSAINFDVIADYQSGKLPTTCKLLHRVVTQKHRETKEKHVVINVNNGMNPMSSFPFKKYRNFADYYIQHHKIKINDLNQPLLEVQGISLDVNNFFSPNRREQLNQNGFFLPELCEVARLPGDYTLKAMLLPSICHRINYLLLAEKLRRWLIDEKIDVDNQHLHFYKLDNDCKFEMNQEGKRCALNQKEIRIISLNRENQSVQQKDLLKVLTILNSGE